MSSTNIDLGNVDYVYLQNTFCNSGNGGDLQSLFTWTIPYMNPKQAPYMYIQVVQLYVDHDDGTGAAQPQHLRFIGANGLNSYSESGVQLAGLMERDAPAGHWSIQGDAPMIQVPTNINSISFEIHRNLNGQVITLGTDGSIDILLKIVRPKQEMITQNIMAANVKGF